MGTSNVTVPSNKFYILELIRTLAAIYVLVYHIQQNMNFGSIFSLLFSFGQESVLIFFVLSGFVISYSVEIKQPTILGYLKARFIRIYPVFIFACLVSYICQSIIKNDFDAISMRSFFQNICMLQDVDIIKPGTWVHPFMGNIPLWSLSYEWWFYMLFIPVYFLIPKSKQYLVVSILSSIGLLTYLYIPNQISIWISYFILWWLGVEVSKKYFFNEQARIDKKIFVVVLIHLLILIVYAFFYRTDHSLSFGLFPILLIRHYFMALCFALILWLYDLRKMSISKNNLLVYLAPYTYSLYVFHYPLLQLFEQKQWLSTYWGIPIMLCVLLLLCFFAEDVIQKHIVRWNNFNKKNN